MPQHSTNPETTLHRVDGVQVYAREDAEGKLSLIDTIDEDEVKIKDIADRLQKRGFGVSRRRVPRAGKIYFILNASWAGAAEPPKDPFVRD